MIRSHFAGGVSEQGDMQKGSFHSKEGVRRVDGFQDLIRLFTRLWKNFVCYHNAVQLLTLMLVTVALKPQPYYQKKNLSSEFPKR